jgi:hypothetical protein
MIDGAIEARWGQGRFVYVPFRWVKIPDLKRSVNT